MIYIYISPIGSLLGAAFFWVCHGSHQQKNPVMRGIWKQGDEESLGHSPGRTARSAGGSLVAMGQIL